MRPPWSFFSTRSALMAMGTRKGSRATRWSSERESSRWRTPWTRLLPTARIARANRLEQRERKSSAAGVLSSIRRWWMPFFGFRTNPGWRFGHGSRSSKLPRTTASHWRGLQSKERAPGVALGLLRTKEPPSSIKGRESLQAALGLENEPQRARVRGSRLANVARGRSLLAAGPAAPASLRPPTRFHERLLAEELTLRR